MQNFKLYTTTEAREILGVSSKTVIRMIETGRLPARNLNKIGRAVWRISESDLNNFIESTKNER